jgi:uncharacterized protein involved in exopolysaccharide biosynthesis
MGGQEVDLRDYINVLLKRKKLIIGITLVAIIIAGILSYFVLPPVYEASGSLLVNPKEATVNLTSPEQILSPLSYLPQISVATYKEIVKSKDIEKKVFDKLNLSSPPYNLTLGNFDRMINVINPTNTTLIKVSVQYKDPVLAQKIARNILDETLLYITDLNTTQIQSSKSALEEPFLSAKKELENAQKALADFNSQKDNLDSLNRQRSSYVSALNSYLSDLLLLNSQIAQYENQLSSTRAELKKENKYLTLEKSIIDDPLLSQLAQQLVNENIIYLSGLKVNSEEINPIYEDLRSKEENYTITLSGLKAKKTSLENLATTAQEKIHQLDDEINSKQLELYDLNRKVDMAQTYYSTVSSNYVQSSFTPLSPVTISEEPVLPEKPVKPNKKLNVAIAGIAALFFSILLAFFLEYWYGKQDRNNKEIKA